MGALHSRQSGGNQRENTVMLAKWERENQGPWEVEVSYGGEADLHQHLKGCDKNPGHHKFVPVDQFNVDHLPPGCRDSFLVEVVQALSDLTVRVSVKYVSTDRPELFPGSNNKYPFYTSRGNYAMRVGTGLVCRIDKYPNTTNSSYKNCTCQECKNSPTPKPTFYHIYIQTSAHVVYDNKEANDTTCHLFFDRGGTPESCQGVITLTGFSYERGDEDRDVCEMRYVTHDLSLAIKLDKLVNRWNDYGKVLDQKYLTVESEKGESASTSINDNLTIIVSHPHGCSKQVSVGYCINNVETDDSYLPLTYTTPACPGSSGARVLEFKRGYCLYWNGDLVHSGNLNESKELNFSRNVLL